MADSADEDIWIFLKTGATEVDKERKEPNYLMGGSTMIMCATFLSMFFEHPVGLYFLSNNHFFIFTLINFFIFALLTFLIGGMGIAMGWLIVYIINQMDDHTREYYYPLLSMMNWAEKDDEKKKKIIMTFESYMIDNNIIWIDMTNDEKATRSKEFFLEIFPNKSYYYQS
jgi:hypothetical protein